MRHKVYGRKLGRNKNERATLFRNLIRSLILSGQIETTQAKAKAIKGLVDKLITQAKSPSTKNLVSQFLMDKKIASKLVDDLVPQFQNRHSGYASIVKVGKRVGDDATLVSVRLLIEKPPQKSEAKSLEKVEQKSKPKVKKEKK